MTLSRPDITIVIRAYNEAGPLERLLKRLNEQTLVGQTELIVVDNGSCDSTAKVAKSFGALVLTLPQSEFSYPKSLNIGIAEATAPIVICLVAHAYPESPNWIEAALAHFKDSKTAGVFSYTRPHYDATIWDKFIMLPSEIILKYLGAVSVKSVHMGTFGATNIAFRRLLWLQHPFDETYAAGGEDTAWAAWALQQGYAIIREPAFTVRHSHYLRSVIEVWQQFSVWRRVAKPRQFNRSELSFRKKN